MNYTWKKLNQLNDNPLYDAIGIRVEKVENGKARSVLEPRSAMCWPFPKQPHGGVLSTLMDTTMAWAVVSQLEPDYNCATINLDIHYTLPAKGDRFICTAWITHRSGRLSFVRADIHDAEGQVLALGQATFRIIQVDIFK